MTGLAAALVAAVVGALVGLAADLLSTRWPEHEPDYRRRWPDWRTLVVPLIGAGVGVGLVMRWSEPRDLTILGIYVAVLVVLLAIDLDQRLLPDILTLPLIVFSGAVLALDWSPLLADKSLGQVSGVAAGLGAPAFLLVTDRVLRGQLGLGDVKLAVGIGLMSGIALTFAGLLIASVIFSAVLVALMAARRIGLKTAVPFGPMLILGAFAAALLG
jgi:leader peptidase (prepilin peptidase)/N-methyltransferase